MPRSRRAARTRLPAAERERQILQAASEVFARGNYRLCGTAQIAAAAGITEPTIYAHFASKKALFLRILERIRERILGRWQEASAGEPQDALALLERAGSVYLAGLRDHADDSKIQFQALAECDDPEIARCLRENHEQYVRFFADLVRRGQREGSIRADVDAEAAGWALDGIGFTLTMIRLLHFESEAAEERIAEMLIEASLAWLRSEPPAPARRTPAGREPSRKRRARGRAKER